MASYYDLLGLAPDASAAELRLAYRRLARVYHPDVNPAGAEMMGQLNAALETLSDPQARLEYDRRIGRAASRAMPAEWRHARAHEAEEEAIALAWKRSGGALDVERFRSLYRQAVEMQRRTRTYFKAFHAFESAWTLYEASSAAAL